MSPALRDGGGKGFFTAADVPASGAGEAAGGVSGKAPGAANTCGSWTPGRPYAIRGMLIGNEIFCCSSDKRG